MGNYSVAKARGLWWIIDADGFEVSYVGYEFKKEAEAAARTRAAEDALEDFNYVGSRHHY